MIANNYSKPAWISVERDLPCNRDELIHFGLTNIVLVIDDRQNVYLAFMKKGKSNEWAWFITGDSVLLPFITHWMPIPKPPKE